MSIKYKFYNKSGLFFVSFATIYWIDIFTRQDYFNVITESITYCRLNKGVELFAYCIMPSHIHFIFRSSMDKPMELLRDFKKHTSKAVIEAIKNNPQESRKEWLLWMFEKAGKEKGNVPPLPHDCIVWQTSLMKPKQKAYLYGMSRNYKFHNPKGLYFVSFAVVKWSDVFTRNKYKDIVLESLSFCQKEKGMEIIAWCIMTNHVHLIFRSVQGQHPALLLGDFKRFTSKAIVKAIRENPCESRKEFLLEQFKKAAHKSSNVKDYQFWRHDNKPIELWSNKIIQEKITYIHNNPVASGLVFRPEDYVYSSATDYAGEKGLLNDIVVFRLFS